MMNSLLPILLALVAAPLQGRTPVPPPSEAEVAAESGQRLFVVYEVGDLLFEPTEGGTAFELAPSAKSLEQQTHELAKTIRGFVVPDLEAPLDELSVPTAGTIVALAHQPHQDRIQAFLDLQRSGRGRMIDISTRIVEGPRGQFGALLGIEGSAAILESREEAGELLRRIHQAEGFEVVTAPRMLAAERRRVSIGVLDQVAYVKEYKLHVVEPGGVELVDPIVETLFEGVQLELVGTPIEEDLYALELELELTELERPIPTRMVRLRAGKDGEFEIGVPETNKVTVTSHLVLANGATAVLLAASPTEDRDLAVFFSIDIVEPKAAGTSPRPAPADGERHAK